MAENLPISDRKLPFSLRKICDACLASRPFKIRELVNDLGVLVQDGGCVWADHDRESFIFSLRDGTRVVYPWLGAGSAKGVFRMICAEAAMWARKHGATQFNPYGDHGRAKILRENGSQYRFLVDTMNTPEAQWFRIEGIRISG